MSFYAVYPPSGSNPSVGINGSPAPTSSTEVSGINPLGNLQPLQTDASGNLKVDITSASGAPIHVIVDSSALPTGASTSAQQVLQTADLDALNARLAGSLVPKAFDENVITYVGITTNIATVTYKLAGVTVKTLTLTYDGSSRLIDVLAS